MDTAPFVNAKLLPQVCIPQKMIELRITPVLCRPQYMGRNVTLIGEVVQGSIPSLRTGDGNYRLVLNQIL